MHKVSCPMSLRAANGWMNFWNWSRFQVQHKLRIRDRSTEQHSTHPDGINLCELEQCTDSRCE